MREMHHNEARPVNCDGGRSSMKVQNQVRVWSVGQRTSFWHITDMWDWSVSKLISMDGKMANPPLIERRGARTHRRARTEAKIYSSMVDRYHHYMFDVFNTTIGLPFSALLPNKCVLYQRLK